LGKTAEKKIGLGSGPPKKEKKRLSSSKNQSPKGRFEPKTTAGGFAAGRGEKRMSRKKKKKVFGVFGGLGGNGGAGP